MIRALIERQPRFFKIYPRASAASGGKPGEQVTGRGRRAGSLGDRAAPQDATDDVCETNQELPQKAAFRDFFSVSGFPSPEGADGVMAKIIEFKVPKDFRPSAKWVPPSRRGQVIEFYIPKKSA